MISEQVKMSSSFSTMSKMLSVTIKTIKIVFYSLFRMSCKAVAQGTRATVDECEVQPGHRVLSCVFIINLKYIKSNAPACATCCIINCHDILFQNLNLFFCGTAADSSVGVDVGMPTCVLLSFLQSLLSSIFLSSVLVLADG